MRKLTIGLTIIALVFAMAITANAEPQKFTGTVEEVVEATDRNGNPYLRVIVSYDAELDGIQFKNSVPVNAFDSAMIEQAKALQKGDSLDAIVNYRKLADGREGRTLLKIN
jgi:chaperonin GroEL (HSP60 family)